MGSLQHVFPDNRLMEVQGGEGGVVGFTNEAIIDWTWRKMRGVRGITGMVGRTASTNTISTNTTGGDDGSYFPDISGNMGGYTGIPHVKGGNL